MAYYAFLNENNFVTSVISGVDEDIYQNDNGVMVGGSSENWEIWYGKFRGQNCKRTSYNGKIRKNYAGIGYYYDSIRDAFIPPKPFPSWTLNEQSCLWQSPILYPNDGKMYQWNEEIGNWEEINLTR
jgi:hypothetical protein